MRDDVDRRSWLLLGLVVVAGHLSLFPNVADLDGFYHLGHARSYLETGLFDTSLPWATRSVIADVGGDLWWGFHVLLLPFALVGDVAWGMHAAGFALTAGLALTVTGVLRRHEIPHAGWWAAVFLVAVPNIFFRHLMIRPHVVSMGAGIALLSVLVRGRWWHALLLSALISWVHLSLFWLAPGIAAAYAFARIPATALLGRDDPDTGVPIRLALPAAVVGTLFGWLCRPDALQTARLLNVQLVELFTQKTLEQPLTFAAELSPIPLATLVQSSWLFAVSWIVAIAYVLRCLWKEMVAEGESTRRWSQARTTLALAAGAISVVFFLVALLSARRGMEQWVGFGSVAVAVALGPPLGSWLRGRPLVAALRSPLPALVAALVLIHGAWGAYRHGLNVERVSFPVSTMREAADFLADQSAPGELVFHARWDNFGPLFAFNRTNRYLGGMDPIFQFAHDPQAFWEFFYLSSDVNTDWTCDAFPCRDGVATDTRAALLEHFGARWIVVEPRRNPRLSLYLLNDDGFRLALETQREAVFEILPLGAGP